MSPSRRTSHFCCRFSIERRAHLTMRTLRASLAVVALAALLIASGPSGIAVAAESSAVRSAAGPSETVDLAVMARIRDEGLHRSKVMDTIEHLTDVIGPLLTGSPALRQANDWTR